MPRLRTPRFERLASLALLLLALLPVSAVTAQTTMRGEVGHVWTVALDSGDLTHRGRKSRVVFSDVIHHTEATWVRLFLDGTVLGEGSALRIMSLRDGETQFLGRSDLQQWRRTTAYFNGNALLIELIAAPNTTNRLVVDEIAWGNADRGGSPYCGYCGEDDRTPVSDNSVCRILGGTYSCTGTIIDSESHLITAGHCMSDGTALVCQFDVPPSNFDCTMNHPPIDDQFPVTAWLAEVAGPGNDWAAVLLGTNGSGERPFDRYGVSQPLATSMPAAGVPIEARGYGDDIDQCVRADTLQRSPGYLEQLHSLYFLFSGDVTYGSSGSPVRVASSNRVIGLATHCPCPNVATRVDHPSFAEARDMLFNGVLGDTCETATFAAVGANPFSTTGATDSEFGSPDDSQCSLTYLDWDNSPDTWLVWQPPATGTLSLSTCDSDSYDTSLVIYEGDTCDDLEQIACNGDAAVELNCQQYYSAIDDLSVSALSTYYIRIGGWQAATGSGTLWIEHDSAPATGACCLGDMCLHLLEDECEDADGDFHGGGTSCTPDSCAVEPTGACCIDGDCQDDVTATQCMLNSGDYAGDGTICADSPCIDPCPGDFNHNNQVDVDDLLMVISFFGTANPDLDLDGDGVVDVDDLLIVISNFGPC